MSRWSSEGRKEAWTFTASFTSTMRRNLQPHHGGHVKRIERSPDSAASTVLASHAVDEQRRFCELQGERGDRRLVERIRPFHNLLLKSRMFPGRHLRRPLPDVRFRGATTAASPPS